MEIYRELELDIKYDYQPEEAMVRFDSNGHGYPGCAAYVAIHSITYNGVEIIEAFTTKEIGNMEDEILEIINDRSV